MTYAPENGNRSLCTSIVARPWGPRNTANELIRVSEPSANINANFLGKARKEKETEMNIIPSTNKPMACASFLGDIAKAPRLDMPPVTPLAADVNPLLAAPAAAPAAFVACEALFCAAAAALDEASANFCPESSPISMVACRRTDPFSDIKLPADEAPMLTWLQPFATPLCTSFKESPTPHSLVVARSAAFPMPCLASSAPLATCLPIRSKPFVKPETQSVLGPASPASMSAVDASLFSPCGTTS
mmetsp:Transcript_44573/g.102940  ORF Transcript_44573/g.102940 Transcript_44573/m.102940 type:complete len:245 (+) Transcript_44573:150-884(+)